MGQTVSQIACTIPKWFPTVSSHQIRLPLCKCTIRGGRAVNTPCRTFQVSGLDLGWTASLSAAADDGVLAPPLLDDSLALSESDGPGFDS